MATRSIIAIATPALGTGSTATIRIARWLCVGVKPEWAWLLPVKKRIQ